MVARAFSFSPINRVTSGGGPMNLMSAGLADFGEVGVLAQQSVAGMDRIHIGDFGGADDGGNVEIAFVQARRPDADGFVGKADVQRVAVGFAVDGDGLDAEFLAGTDDAQGDFAAIRNQDFLEHEDSIREPIPRLAELMFSTDAFYWPASARRVLQSLREVGSDPKRNFELAPQFQAHRFHKEPLSPRNRDFIPGNKKRGIPESEGSDHGKIQSSDTRSNLQATIEIRTAHGPALPIPNLTFEGAGKLIPLRQSSPSADITENSDNQYPYAHKRNQEDGKHHPQQSNVGIGGGVHSLMSVSTFQLCRMANSGIPYSTGLPLATSILAITPDTSASISFISFMASMMQRTWPS